MTISTFELIIRFKTFELKITTKLLSYKIYLILETFLIIQNFMIFFGSIVIIMTLFP